MAGDFPPPGWCQGWQVDSTRHFRNYSAHGSMAVDPALRRGAAKYDLSPGRTSKGSGLTTTTSVCRIVLGLTNGNKRQQEKAVK